LREGGSLPALVQADDGQLYVLKFTGAGQGPKALIAELVAGEIARAMGLAVPEIVFMTLDTRLGHNEGDPEIKALIEASAGLNLAMRFLPKAFAFNPLLEPPPDPALAATVVWFDAFVTNVDRTARNTNLLLWQSSLWLIDHGASLYFHHMAGSPDGYLARSRNPYPQAKDHVLLPFAGAIPDADARQKAKLTPEQLAGVTGLIPDDWLGQDGVWVSPDEHRAAYAGYLAQRLESSQTFVQEAERARSALL
jgi:hypothetical protein